MEELKENIKLVLAGIGLHFVYALLFISFTLTFYFTLYKYELIEINAISFVLIILIPFLISGIPSIFVYIGCFSQNDKMRDGVLKSIFPILIPFLLLNIFSYSIYLSDSFSSFNYEAIIVLEWSIFGVSAAILVFWIQTMNESVDKVITHDDETKYPLNFSYRTLKLERIKNSLEPATPAIIFININLISLIFSTAFYYLQYDNINNYFINFLIIFSFMFSTNSLVQVFRGVIDSFKERKKALNERIKLIEAMEKVVGKISKNKKDK